MSDSKEVQIGDAVTDVLADDGEGAILPIGLEESVGNDSGTGSERIGGLTWETSRRRLQVTCCPNPLSKENVPVLFCLLALILTFGGSWTCTYFHGAETSFSGNSYGIWTVEDVNGKCQLWDILFYSYTLGGPLEGARFCSMGAMLVGLANLTTMIQAQQAHIVSWAVGFFFVVLFLVSVCTSDIFNIWILFWLFTYCMLTVIVRALFIHPVHRKISKRGSMYIGSLFGLCAVLCICTLVMLLSNYCTCDTLTSTDLENGFVEGGDCDGGCNLGSAGYVMMFASAFWLATAIVTYKFGIQQEIIKQDPSKAGIVYKKTSRESITTKAIRAANTTVGTVKEAGHAVVSVGADATADEEGNVDEEDGGAENESFVHAEDAGEEPAAVASDEEEEDDVDMEVDEDEEEEEWHQSRCQRLCCDLRITERSKKERRRFGAFRTLLCCMVGVYVFLLVSLIGSRVENRNAERAPDTSIYFITDVVCAFDENDVTAPFVTFQTPTEARAANLTIAHCGACSFCSNLPDIETYVLTRKTIAKTAKKCGTKAIFGKYRKLADCLEGKIGFTRDCTYCWADNMKSTAENCLFTCMKTLFTGFMTNNNVPGAGRQGWLNQCLQCDEKLSGPDFVTCSGAARRRLGIASEIERNPAEQCPYVDVDWIDYLDAPTDDGDL